MKLLAGKTAIITGASRGIGKAIALEYAAQGANVAITATSMSENLLSTVKEIEALGVVCKGYASDAADFDATHSLVSQIVADFGKIDILVNNAGITRDGLIMRMTEAQWDQVINTNLKSVFNFTQSLVPVMARQKSGSIINLSSIVGINGNAGQANYAASKAGIIGFTKSIAREMGSRNIRANVIAPGFIQTDMTDALPEQVREDYNKRIPLRRLGQTKDIANAAVFLGSDMANYITAQVLTVDGGLI